MKRALLPCALALAACARGTPPPAEAHSPAAADTLRGRLEVVGSEPGTSVVLLDGRGGGATLEGERTLLSGLAGLEVMVRGRPTGPRTFQVDRFTVRASEGIPTVDGILARENGRDVLVLEDGRRVPLATTPAALRGRYGARIWVAGEMDHFGVIRP